MQQMLYHWGENKRAKQPSDESGDHNGEDEGAAHQWTALNCDCRRTAEKLLYTTASTHRWPITGLRGLRPSNAQPSRILAPAASQSLPPSARLVGFQIIKDRHNGRSLLIACSALGNNRRRWRGFALAVVRSAVGLCRGRDAKESHRYCRQKSNLLHISIPLCWTETHLTKH